MFALFHLLQMFSEIHNGRTKFSLNISDSCEHCYNARLLKVKCKAFIAVAFNTMVLN